MCNLAPMSMERAPQGAHIPEWTTGERLRKAREDAGLSQQQLADEISVSRRQIIYYENNAKTPTRGEFLLWQMITSVPAEWLKTGMRPENNGGPDGTTPGEKLQIHNVHRLVPRTRELVAA